MTATSFGLIALILGRTKTQPTCEVLLRGKPTDVHTDFGQNDQGRSHADSLDFCQVYTQCLEQRARRLESGIVAFATTRAGFTSLCLLSRPVFEFGQFGFNLLVTIG